jgi:hypothetical protein
MRIRNYRFVRIKLPKTLLALPGLLLILMVPAEGKAQGCIAVRGGGQCSLNHLHDFEAEMMGEAPTGEWQVSFAHRWLHSFRHFAGTKENTTRIPNDTEVINDSHFIDIGLNYQISSRYSASLFLPYVNSDRSSKYEHGDPADGRHYIGAEGIADMRASVYGWIIDPAEAPKGNLQLGFGLKLPTGDYRATDTFQGPRGPETHFVDQSIQPGDGGWGFTTEFYTYHLLSDRLSVYAQGFYLFNPEGINGVSTEHGNGVRGKTYQALLNGAAGGDPVAAARLANAQALGFANYHSLEDVMSITDQYLARAGASYLLDEKHGIVLSLGARVEGIPAEDALGSLDGFRRPGFTISVEPGISITRERWSAGVAVPVAVLRDRVASVADERWGRITGLGTVKGDAAFADYTINTYFTYRF